jgi:hypothetical protein
MTIYTVVWKRSAEQQLAALWLLASNRNAVTRAAARIDLLLWADPDQQGTPIFDTIRQLIVPPLGVEFEVVEDDRIVWVLSVWTVSGGLTP